jgi:hypothetical protein
MYQHESESRRGLSVIREKTYGHFSGRVIHEKHTGHMGNLFIEILCSAKAGCTRLIIGHEYDNLKH